MDGGVLDEFGRYRAPGYDAGAGADDAPADYDISSGVQVCPGFHLSLDGDAAPGFDGKSRKHGAGDDDVPGKIDVSGGIVDVGGDLQSFVDL